MHDGLKCGECVMKALVGKLVTPESTQAAVNGAKTAVTVYDGKAVCVEHLYECVLLHVKF